MRQRIVKELEELRRRNLIKSYEFKVNKDSEGSRVIAEVELLINGKCLTKQQLGFNPERQNFGRVTDILCEKIEAQLTSTGIMALYSNLYQEQLDGDD